MYYKFKSAKDYDSVMIDGHFISVGLLKEKLFESKDLGKVVDEESNLPSFESFVTNAQTNEGWFDSIRIFLDF
ncbi:zinc finger CCCH domain-containing 18-like isoform X1, partial [Olea europaea subsp. europaea]